MKSHDHEFSDKEKNIHRKYNIIAFREGLSLFHTIFCGKGCTRSIFSGICHRKPELPSVELFTRTSGYRYAHRSIANVRFSKLIINPLCNIRTYDKEVREVFSTKRHNTDLHRKLLTPEETVKRLIRIIEENKFENGARIDYFDKC